MNPLVSICCNSYNHEKYIRQAIESFLKQDTNFVIEVLIHDDASIDNSQQIIKEYEFSNQGIITSIFQSVNQYSKGIKPWPNFVFPRARGKYIALCEGDDFWLDPLKLQKQVDFLETNENYIMSFHNTIGVYPNQDSDIQEIVNNVFEVAPDMIPIGNQTHTSSVLFRNVIKDYPHQYNEVVNGDTFLFFLLSRYGKRTYQNNIYPSVRRYHNSSVWASKNKEYKKEQKIITYSKMLEIAINDEERNRIQLNIIKEHIQVFQHQFSRFKIKSGFKTLFLTLKIAIKQKNFLIFFLYGVPGLFYLSRIPYKVYAKLKYHLSNS